MEKLEYTVSHSPYEHVLEACNLTEQDILNLPHHAAIVEVGSGERLEFAQAVKALGRDDLQMVSIDPTLALSPESPGWRILETGTFIDYQHNQWNRSDPRFRQTQQARLAHAQKVGGAVAALAPDLPLRPDSVNLLIDSMAAGLYLQQDRFLAYIKEIERVLKPGGTAVISDLRFATSVFDDPIAWVDRSTQEILAFMAQFAPNFEVNVIHHNGSAGMLLKKGLVVS